MYSSESVQAISLPDLFVFFDKGNNAMHFVTITWLDFLSNTLLLTQQIVMAALSSVIRLRVHNTTIRYIDRPAFINLILRWRTAYRYQGHSPVCHLVGSIVDSQLLASLCIVSCRCLVASAHSVFCGLHFCSLLRSCRIEVSGLFCTTHTTVIRDLVLYYICKALLAAPWQGR